MSALQTLLAAIEEHLPAIRTAVADGRTLESGELTGASDAVAAIAAASAACVTTAHEGFTEALRALHEGASDHAG